jgi:membrane-associated HD superfamily phosphohydrolase
MDGTYSRNIKNHSKKKNKNPVMSSPITVLRSVLLLFVMVATNHVGDLLGCSTRRLLTQTWAKHLLAYLVLVIFVVAVDGAQYAAEFEVTPSLFVLALSALAYLLFFLATKCHSMVLLLAIVVGVVVVLMDIEIKQATGEKRAQYEEIQLYMAWSLVPLLVIGFGFYLWKQYHEHHDFQWSRFVGHECTHHRSE